MSLAGGALAGPREGLRRYREAAVMRRSCPPARAALELAAPIEGFTSPAELSLLYHLTVAAPGSGRVVEIGSYLGRSTVVLARAVADSGREPVVAVDPHLGALTPEATESFDTRADFLQNIARADVHEHVELVQASSTRAAARWTGQPVRLLFLDALHTRHAVLEDVQAWAPHLADDPCVVFDDYFTSGEVRAAVDEIVGAGMIAGEPIAAHKILAFGPKEAVHAVPVGPGSRRLTRRVRRALAG